jgi:hypothetical protein
MRNLAISLLLLLQSGALLAQDDCSDAAILDKKGTWEKRPDANIQYDKNGAQINRYLDTIGKMFISAVPEPKGIRAGWYRTMDFQFQPGWPIAYTFTSLYFCWYCNVHVHKLMLADETGTWAYVYVNHWGWFFGDRPKETDLKTDGAFIYNLPDKVGTWKGYDIYQSTVLAPSNRCVVLARRGSSPWKPVTQEQYLKSVRAFYLDQEKKLQGPSPQQRAADDQKEIDRIQNNPNLKPEAKEAMLKGIRERQQMESQSTAAASIRKGFDDYIRVVDNYLNSTPADQLQQPAILPRQGRTLFDGKFTTIQNGGQMKVAANPDFFKNGLPYYRPQFMVLFWRWERTNPASMNFVRQLEADFPVERLQAMLDY